MRINCRHRSASFYAVVSVIFFGFLLIGLNVYQLWNLPWFYGGLKQGSRNDRVAWICAKRTFHLNHVMKVFRRLGYQVVHSEAPPYYWNVMWAFDFPFNKQYLPYIRNVKEHQKVNHVPGTGYFTLKVELATSKSPWIPQAFSMPDEKLKLANEAKMHPDKLWVQKSNNHRGIRIVDLKGLDLNAEDTFVQMFVKNPILIDGKKFDIGVYTVITSVNPLRVYVYEDEMLIRFCMKNYKPFDSNVVEKYVVGEDYIAPSELPSLKPYMLHSHLSRKEALFTYLRSKGKNITKVWNDVKQAIAELFISKEEDLIGLYSHYPSKYNFFELVRVDFIIDEDMNVWLMEVNMSPNLSSSGHPQNGVMYEQVLFNALSLVGIATYTENTLRQDVREMLVNDRDIFRGNIDCLKAECLLACIGKCALCNPCLTEERKTDFKHAFMEHNNRGNYRRILPPSQELQKGRRFRAYSEASKESNGLLMSWFQSMCDHDRNWCQ